MKYVLLLLFLAWSTIGKTIYKPSCDSKIYCQGPLLDTVQRNRIYNDSKTFVDMKMRKSEQEILKNFEIFMNSTSNKPSKEQVRKFVADNFEDGNELENWSPPDYNPDPKFLSHIKYWSVRDFARILVSLWPNLGREVKPEVLQNPERYSLIPVPNGFIVPGGRFREFYYWDSYWIVQGLLISEMPDTVRGVLENFISLVKRYGFIPNGSRVYYLNRSQPPLLTLMASSYIKSTNNVAWLKKNIQYFDQELQFWLKNKIVDFRKNCRTYYLAHYDVESGSPRPESYAEDVKTADYYPEEDERKRVYADIKSGAESGWDFSSRWIFDKNGGNNANLSFIETRRVIPVDLNAFLFRAFQDMSDFYTILGEPEPSASWAEKANTWKKTINEVLWNETDGTWYDYDVELEKHREYFFPSNVAPLWTGSYEAGNGPKLGKRVVEYLKREGILDYPGGTPTSLSHTGEQWDFPNAWPPLQAIVIQGLERSGDKSAQEMAEKLAKRWIDANRKGYLYAEEMFEKYDAEKAGHYGGGGEYTVQSGFGWTNGVALEFINTYYTDYNNTKKNI